MDNITATQLGFGFGGNGFTGLSLFDSNLPGTIPPSALSAFNILQIPSYWRATNFLANNLMAFPRSITRGGVRQPHKLDNVLTRKPNNYQSCSNFWRTLWFHACHFGSGYAKIVTTGGKVSLHNILPEMVVPYRYSPTDDFTAPENWEQYYFIMNTKEYLHSSEVIHISGISYNGMVGMNPTVYMRETFQRALLQDQYYTRFLTRGTVMRGAIQIPATATPEQQDEIITLLATRHQGANAERDIIVLSGGATLNNATLSPRDSQLTEQGVVTTTQISQITGVPPQFLYEFKDAKYNDSIEQMGALVVRDTFGHWVETGEDELSLKLLTDNEYSSGLRISIDPDALSKADTQTLSATVVAQRNAGIISANEARAELGRAKSADPAAESLQILGNTAGKLPEAAPNAPGTTGAPVKASAALPDARNAWSSLAPILADACARVDQKTDKAFEAKADKPQDQRIPYLNALAESQARFVSEALEPVLKGYQALGGDSFDIAKAANRYALSIRKRAADGTVTQLSTIIEGLKNEQE